MSNRQREMDKGPLDILSIDAKSWAGTAIIMFLIGTFLVLPFDEHAAWSAVSIALLAMFIAGVYAIIDLLRDP